MKHLFYRASIIAFLGASFGCSGPPPETAGSSSETVASPKAIASAPPLDDASASAAPTPAKMVVTQGGLPTTAPIAREKKRPSLRERTLLTRIEETLKGETASDYFERGVLYLTVAEKEQISPAYEHAAEDFSQALKADPKLVGAYNNRAMAYARMGEEEKALADFQAASKLAPKDADILGRQASILSKLGREEEAIAAYDKAFALGNVDFMFNRGNAYARLGKTKEAMRDYRLVAEKSKNPQLVEAAKMNLEALASE